MAFRSLALFQCLVEENVACKAILQFGWLKINYIRPRIRPNEKQFFKNTNKPIYLDLIYMDEGTQQKLINETHETDCGQMINNCKYILKFPTQQY